MAYGNYGRRRPGGGLEILAALLRGAGGYVQGSQQRRAYQDQRRDSEEERQLRQQRQQWAQEDRVTQRREREAAPIEDLASADPDNALRYRALGLAKRQGVAPPPTVPHLPVFMPGPGGGLASLLSEAQQHAGQRQADTQFLTGMTGVRPGRTPQQITLQQAIAKMSREHQDALELERERQKGRGDLETLKQTSRERLAAVTNAARSGNAAAANKVRLFNTYLQGGGDPDEFSDWERKFGAQQGITEALSPDLQPAAPAAPAFGNSDPNDLLKRLFRRTSPASAAPAPASPAAPPINAFPQGTRAQSQIRTNDARTAVAESQIPLNNARFKEALSRIPVNEEIVRNLRSTMTFRQKQGEHLDRADKIAAFLANVADGRLSEQTRHNLASEALGQARQALSESAFAAKQATPGSKAAKMDPADVEELRTVRGQIGRLEGQINKLQGQGLAKQATPLYENLADLTRRHDDILGKYRGTSTAAPSGDPVKAAVEANLAQAVRLNGGRPLTQKQINSISQDVRASMGGR